MTNDHPAKVTPRVGGYKACAEVGPALGRGETKTLPCVATGRYLIVQLKGKNYLTLCEVDVQGGMYHIR